MKRWSWLSALVGLVVGAAALGIPFAVYAAQDAEDDAYRACMASLGIAEGMPTAATVDELVAAAEICMAR